IHEAAAEIADKDEYFPSRSRMLRAIREKLPFQQHRFIETVDASGVKCFFDPQKNEFMYSAPNCPEGREFLELLKSLGAKQDQTLLRAKRKIQTREPGE
ncbi:MAG: hypothetical protein ACRD2O_00005, partial [Terriglobia bacterium]